MLGRAWQAVRAEWKLALYAIALVIEAAAATVLALVGKRAFGATLAALVIAALVVTAAKGFRELVREATGNESRAAREVRRSHRLLDFLEDSFPLLTEHLAVIGHCTDRAEHARRLAEFERDVLTEAGAVGGDKTRVALFERRGEALVPREHCPGWRPPPQLPEVSTGEGLLIWEVLAASNKVFSEDVDTERSARALVFKFGPDCRSFVSVPVRCAGQLRGFVHLESPEPRSFDRRAAALIEAFGQLLGVAWSMPVPRNGAAALQEGSHAS